MEINIDWTYHKKRHLVMPQSQILPSSRLDRWRAWWQSVSLSGNRTVSCWVRRCGYFWVDTDRWFAVGNRNKRNSTRAHWLTQTGSDLNNGKSLKFLGTSTIHTPIQSAQSRIQILESRLNFRQTIVEILWLNRILCCDNVWWRHMLMGREQSRRHE